MIGDSMKRKTLVIGLALLTVAAVAVVEVRLASRFGDHEIAMASSINRPSVIHSRPSNSDSAVLPNTFVSCDLSLPNTGAGVDATTLGRGTRLYRTDDGKPVAMKSNTSGAGDSIVCTPDDLLEPDTRYTFEVTSDVRDTSGASFSPYRMTFVTARGATTANFPIAFERVEMKHTQVMVPGTQMPSAYTCLTIGPDGKLYAGTFDGRILRFVIKPDGQLAEPDAISTVQAANRGPRLITGVTFDPASTAGNLIAWISHGQMAINEGRIEGADDWTGKISTLRGPGLSEYQDVVVGLPRGFKDHLNFQIAFGPDGALYFCQGSNTSVGAPDKKWNYRPERKLTAACLRLDPRLLTSLPLDVKTDDGGSYDPSAAGAPLTIHATGVRSGFDLLWHSNGKLYTGLNGAAAGGNVPAGPKSPAINNIRETTNDLLLVVDAAGYYGHPNPARNQFVLMGGNPTAERDPQQIDEYPVGTNPEPNFRAPAFDFGKSVSPNGLTEYTSSNFGGALRGRILVTRYSGGKDVIVLTPGADGNIVESVTGIDGLKGFSDPLDIVEDASNGNLYIAEYGGRQITLVRPREGATSSKVFLQTIAR